MTKGEARKRIQKLREEIEHHRYLYHVLDRQEISDAANDSLKHELQELEREFPDLVTPDSPTQRVGGEPRKELRRVTHRTPMLSLEDIFLEKELGAWDDRNHKVFPQGTYRYVCEEKVDGLAVELRYEKGVLVEASTRGDGRVGEDITANVKTIESIPLRLRAASYPSALTVRGEIYMRKEQFERLNKNQKRLGHALYANPRNVAAGSVRQLDPRVTAARHLACVVYDIVTDGMYATHHEEHEAARAMGFKTTPHLAVCETLAEVKTMHAEWAKRRASLPYWVDGVVVSVDDNATFQELGVAGKAPRGAVAFKFPAEETTTIVKDILVQVGRTGALTPVAVLEPVHVGGTTVSRATLHNAEEVHRKDVRIGDTVVIRKAGDIIPEVVSVLLGLRPKHTSVFTMPSRCPICGSAVIKDGNGPLARCSNRQCAAQQERALRHFVSRAAADIEGVGPKLIRKLLEVGLVRDAADLYRISEEDIANLERYAEKSAANLIQSIRARRILPLGRFLYGLGMLHVGTVTANDLAAAFGSLEKLQSASLEDIQRVDGVGDIVGRSVYTYIHHQRTARLLKKFREVGLRIERLAIVRRGPLSGKTVVVTGSLGTLSREDAWESIRTMGGTVSESVGKGTQLLIMGDDPGSKLEKAKKLGVDIMEKEAFLRLVRSQKSA